MSFGGVTGARNDNPGMSPLPENPINVEFSIDDIEFSPSFQFRGIDDNRLFDVLPHQISQNKDLGQNHQC